MSKSSNLKKILFIAAVIVVAVAIIGLNVYNYVKDSGFAERRTVAVSSENGNFSLSQAQMTYYFYSQYQSFYSQFASYGMDMSSYIDTSLPLSQQQCTFSSNQTWYEYFMSSAIESAKQQLALCEAAKAEGVELRDSDMEAIDATIESMKEQATEAGYSNLAAFLKSNYGSCVAEKDVREAMKLELLASLYVEKKVDEADVSAETIEKIYADDPDSYDKVSYLEYTFDYNDIIEAQQEEETEEADATEEETTETTEETEVDSETKAAAIETVETYVEKIKQVTTDESFEEVVKDYLMNALGMTEEEADQSLEDTPVAVENASLTTTDEVLAWAFEDGRAVGELNVFEETEDHEHSEDEAEDAHDTLGTVYTAVRMTKLRGKVTDITAKDVRHILFEAESYEDDSKAQEVYKKWVDDGAKVEDFAALAKEYSDDTGSVDNGGLYENVTEGQMVTEFNDWLFAEDREVGDHSVVETTYGWHVMYCEGETESWQYDIINEIQTQASDDATHNATSDYAVNVDYDVLAKIAA